MFTPILRSALIASVVVASASASLTTTTEAHAGPVHVVSIKLTDLDKQFVPLTVVHGDREFNGNGPDVTVVVQLSVTADQSRILASIDFTATETKADWSETHGNWAPEVYRAPPGKKIVGIVDTSSSVIKFRSKPAGFQLLAPTQDWLNLLNDLQKVNQALLTFMAPGAPQPHTAGEKQMKLLADQVVAGTGFLSGQGNRIDLRTSSTGPVRLIGVVGDTGGPDISTDEDPKDDTRIVGIKFRPIKIRLQ